MKLGLIIPCYNEEAVLHETTERIFALVEELIAQGEIDDQSFVCFVDDGSTDKSWEILLALKQKYAALRAIRLSRNFGHQNALIAGLMQCKDDADALISLDADLQDDIALIAQFVTKYKEGYDVIYGVRSNRESDSHFKRKTANIFYAFQRFMGIESVEHHADYRLLSRKALQALAEFKEVNLFLRGIVPLLGFRSCSIYYTRSARFAGETKYPLRKMLLFALDGITSFSVRPLRFITMVGFFFFLLALGGIFWVVIEKYLLGNTVQGWASTLLSIYLIGGIQMMSLGIIGEYIGRIFQESKARPRFIIDSEI